MAPSKAHFFQRVHSPRFLGINWTKVCWFTPYNQFYPMSICAGNQTRMFSGPIGGGHHHNRTTLNTLRNIVLYAPSLALFGVFFTMADWYDCVYFANHVIMQRPMPDWAENRRKAEQAVESREKPGYILKHKLGGQISIPGSEINIA